MKTCGEVAVQNQAILKAAPVRGQWSASRPGRPFTHWIGDWVDLRVSLDDVEKGQVFTLPGIELGPVCRPARRQSLYRLSYRAAPVGPM
jgi:hypothetical protein